LNTDSPDSKCLPRLLDLLRHELRQYGEILALLDQQQESVMARSPEDVLSSVNAINVQMAQVATARQDREACQRELAKALGVDGEPEFRHLLPRVSGTYRPALEALVRENNELLFRVQKRARQNHLLLSRSVELMQRFVSSLLPATAPVTYTDGGQLRANARPVQPMYQAVG
jgi:flagellar biosynthesis/type III secretory pathway chaperone